MYSSDGEQSFEDFPEEFDDTLRKISVADLMDHVRNGSSFVPGTAEKMLVLATRYDCGLPLWHPKDFVPCPNSSIEITRNERPSPAEGMFWLSYNEKSHHFGIPNT